MVDLDAQRELVDVVVNGVPLAILLLFAVVFLLLAPWGIDGFATTVQITIILSTAAALVTVTYWGSRLIRKASGERSDLTTAELDREEGQGEAHRGDGESEARKEDDQGEARREDDGSEGGRDLGEKGDRVDETSEATSDGAVDDRQ